MVIAALVAACGVSVAAQAQVEAPAWGGGAVVERVIGWIGGWWTVVAGSETEPVPAEDGDVGDPVPGGPGVGESLESPLPETEVYPEFDPNGPA
jgi:hypothetical protein